MRYESAACVPPSGNQLYVTGVGENRNETWKWEPAGSVWTRCADMIQGRYRYCAIFANSMSMYVLGGMVDKLHDEEWTTTILDSVEKYDLESNEWTIVGQLMRPTCYAACAVYDNSIYVFGGRCHIQEKTSLNCVQVFDTVSKACTTLTQRLPRPLQMLRAVTWDDRFVVITGKHDCVVFDLCQKTFQQRRKFAAGVNQFGLVLEDQQVFHIGGHTKVKDADGRAYRPTTDEVKSVAVMDIINELPANWSHHATLPQPAFIHAFAVMTLPPF